MLRTLCALLTLRESKICWVMGSQKVIEVQTESIPHSSSPSKAVEAVNILGQWHQSSFFVIETSPRKKVFK